MFFHRYISLLSLILLIFFGVSGQVYAQKQSTIKGVITDEGTGEFLSFVSVSLKDRPVGSLTDSLGRFSFKVNAKQGDSIRINYVGYVAQVYALNSKPVQNFTIKLKEESYLLGEILVTADPNPGRSLMKKVVSQNEKNNPVNLNRIHTRRWELKEVGVFDPKADEKNITSGIIFGDKARIFSKLRQEDDSLKKETPLFFSEKISDYELTRDPFSESENQIAVRTTGFETDRLLEPLVKWNAGDINLYDDWVLLFNKAFVSPIGKDAFSYYHFYIVDSLSLPRGYYNITFQAIPKNWRDNVFTGYFTVNDSSFALVSADLRLSKNANINYIEAIRIQQQYTLAADVSAGSSRYSLKESKLSLQYLANLESLGIPLPISLGDKIMICKMTVRHSEILLNAAQAANFAKSGALVTSINLLDTGHDEAYWTALRPDSLTKREALIYEMAAQLKSDTRAVVKEKFLSTIVSGVYYIGSQFYIGPLGSLISYNRIEGIRFRLSVRTMEKIFPKSGIYGHIAYGLKDERFKSSIGLRHIWRTQPYSRSQLAYSSDYDVVTEWYDQNDKDNLTNSLLRKRSVPYYRVFMTQTSVSHDQQLGANFMFHLGMNYQTLDPAFKYEYPNPAFISNDLTPDEALTKHKVPITEITLGIRFAFHESAKIHNYTRFPLASTIPVIAMSYSQGIKFRKSDFKYQKLSVNVNHTSHLTPKIELLWNLEAGQIFGKVASLILHQPGGSDAWVISHRVFNLMTPYEFTADKYIELHSRFHFGGLLFDKIPWIQKFQLRERIVINSFWGSLSNANEQFNLQQNAQSTQKDPYVEVGVGIDNIFHLLSVHYLQRINYLKSPGAKGNHRGIFLGLKFIF